MFFINGFSYQWLTARILMQYINRPFRIFQLISKDFKYFLSLGNNQKFVLCLKNEFLCSVMDIRIKLVLGSFLDDNFCYESARNELVFILVLYGHPLYHTILLNVRNNVLKKIKNIIFEVWFTYFWHLIAINLSLFSIRVLLDSKIDCATYVVQKTTKSSFDFF